jgi:hypothetical protein
MEIAADNLELDAVSAIFRGCIGNCSKLANPALSLATAY